MDEKKKEADSVSHFSAERIFGFWGGKNAQYFGLAKQHGGVYYTVYVNG